jgi:catechol 2,3-dioxygenase-like lactoylglutathione lyase family enzyme
MTASTSRSTSAPKFTGAWPEIPVRLNHVTLLCSDVARSLSFYRGLGLEPIVLEPGADGAPRYARLLCPDGDATLSLERSDGAPAAGAGPTGLLLYFECDDLDARVSALSAAGYVFAGRPETQPWLWREAELVDPDGNRVRLYFAGSYRLDPPWRLPGSGGVAGAGAAADADADIAPFLAARNQGYADAPIPSARDDELAGFLEGLAAAGAEARESAAARLGPPYTGTLLTFGERMATTAVREGHHRAALLGLQGVALAWREASDVRPLIPVLAVLYDAAKRVAADPAAVFRQAAGLAPPDVAPVFEDFLTRPDLEDIAAEMGYAEGRDRVGFRYRRQWGSGRID